LNIRRLFERYHPSPVWALGSRLDHSPEGELQALLDGELPHARKLVVRAHLLRCASCRARAASASETAALVNALLRRTTPNRAAKAQPRLARRLRVAAVALAGAALIAMLARGVSRAGAGADAFALVQDAQAHPAKSLLRDACCSDHDGGDRPDDGLLTLSSVGEKVTVVVVYEDVDHSGTFTHGDIVRYVSTIPHGTAVAHSAR
jgi:hypothetical protein